MTGAVSLLYAAPCERLLRLSRSDPPAAARLVREALLSTVTQRATLQRKTVTGGSLNVAAALASLLDNCGSDPAPLTVLAQYPNPSDGRFRLLTNAVTGLDAGVRIYDLLGRSLGTAPATPVSGEAGTYEVNLTMLPAGIYLLYLSDGDRTAATKVIIR